MVAIWMIWKGVRLLCGLAMLAALIALALHLAPAVYSNGEGGESVLTASWGAVAILGGLAVGLALVSVALQVLFGVLYGEEEL